MLSKYYLWLSHVGSIYKKINSDDINNFNVKPLEERL